MDKALESLKLAKSYLEEVENASDALESLDKSSIYRIENTLNLAKKQIDIAEGLNPKVSIEDHDLKEIYDLKEAKISYFLLKGELESLGKGNYSAAISNLKKALELDPEFDAAYSVLSLCYWETGNKQEALKSIRKAIELSPENIEYKKTFDRMSSTSGALLAARTFKGSWKVLLTLAGFTILGTYASFSYGSVGNGILCLLIGGAITFGYWKIKHHKGGK